MLDRNPEQRKALLEEASKNAQDLTTLVKRKRPQENESEDAKDIESSSKRLRALEASQGTADNGQKELSGSG